MKYQRYLITQQNEKWTLSDFNIENAATEYAKQTYGKNHIARRATGTSGLSGYFQTYTIGNPQNSVGTHFHISKE